MSPIWGHVAGVITVILMGLFIGIWIWAWRARHKPVFNRLARIPMGDELTPPPAVRKSAAQDDDKSAEVTR